MPTKHITTLPYSKSKTSFDDLLCSPESTAKTGDSGIESLAQRLSEDTQLGSSLGSSPIPPSTGNDEADQCLMYHFTYCDRLLEVSENICLTLIITSKPWSGPHLQKRSYFNKALLYIFCVTYLPSFIWCLFLIWKIFSSTYNLVEFYPCGH